MKSATRGSLPALILFGAMLTAAQAEDTVSTVGSVTQNNGLTESGHLIVMTPSILRVAPSQAPSPDLRKAIAEYDRVVQLSAPPELRAEAMRRSAYLRVWLADAGEQGDGPELRKAIATYEQLLRDLPDDPANDLALYQLARAWQLAGDGEQAIVALRKLGRGFPRSSLIADAHLRAGELLYARARYAEAEAEYAAVVALGPDAKSASPYYAIAQYKYGWSLYQQAKYEQALPVFLAILDQDLPAGAVADPAVLDAVDRKKQEFARDALRVAGLSFAALGGGKAMNPYFAAHGEPRFGTLLYVALGKAFLDQRRYSDAAEVYAAFIDRHADHVLAPEFQQRAIAAYRDGGFSVPLIQAKETYAQRYFPGAPYWRNAAPTPQVLTALRGHLDDLGRHYQSQAQKLPADDKSGRQTAFARAAHAYERLLRLNPEASQRAAIGMLYADALLDGGQTRKAAEQYLHTAYDQPSDRSREAAYAAVQAYQRLAQEADAAGRPAALRESVAAAQRLTDRFADHPQWPAVMTRSAQDLYELHDDRQALVWAQRALQAGKPLSPAQRGELLAVVADAQFAQKDYAAAEAAYIDLLKQAPLAETPRRTAIEHLAVAVYKQGEAARAAGDQRGAAVAFQRVNRVAPGSSIAATADYDAAAALIQLRDWQGALLSLEAFRDRYPQHVLGSEVDKKLAYVYEQNQQPAAAAQAYARVAQHGNESLDTRQEAAWQAAQLYDRARMTPAATAAYENYVAAFSQNLDRGLSARRRLADLARDYSGRQDDYRRWLQEIVGVDARAGSARNDGSRHMAAQASLELARLDAARARSLPLGEPLARSLLLRKQATESAIDGLLRAAAYGDADVTSAATYEIGAAYRDFGRALLASEKPASLSGEAAEQYQILLEEQADPFERKSIEAHEANLRRVSQGLWNDWIHRSATQLAELAPARYGKHEVREERYEALR